MQILSRKASTQAHRVSLELEGSSTSVAPALKHAVVSEDQQRNFNSENRRAVGEIVGPANPEFIATLAP